MIFFQPKLLEKIKRCQKKVMRNSVTELTGEEISSQKNEKGILRFSSTIWISNWQNLKQGILQKAQDVSRFETKILVAKYETRDCRMGQ